MRGQSATVGPSAQRQRSLCRRGLAFCLGVGRGDVLLDVLERLKTWLDAQLATVSQKSTIAEAIRYAHSRWSGLTRFLDDGRVEIDSNVVERAIRPLALNRKNALFAGSDGGGEHWAIHASLIETCKLNAIDPHAYLADVFARLVAGHPINRIDELLPWRWAAARPAQRAA